MKFVWGLLGTLALTSAAHAVPVVIQVNGPDGKPVAGAEVRMARTPDVEAMEAFFSFDEPLRESARSDEKGVVRFDWPEPKFNAMLGLANRFMGMATIWAPGLGAANVAMVPGENRVKLAVAGIARGTVRDAKGVPVAGAKVRALGALGMEKLRNFNGRENFAVPADEATFLATSDAQGRWQIGNLPLGTKAMVQLEGDALASDVALASVVPEAGDAPFVAVPIDQIPDGANQKGELIAAPAATLTGRVLSPQGEAVPGVSLWLEPAQNQIQIYAKPKVARTNANGEYVVSRLEADTYRLILTTPETLSLVAKGSPFDSVKLDSGQTLRAPDQKLLQSGTLVLNIIDAVTGKPVAGVRATVQSSNNGRDASSYSDETGTLQMHLAADTYKVQVWKTPDAYLYPEMTAPFAIVENQNQNLTIKLQTGALATGRVLDANGNGVPDLAFSLIEDREGLVGGSSMVETDANGAWKTQRFAPGHYKITLNQNPSWALAKPTTIDIPRNGFDIKVNSIPQTQLAGRVVDNAGQGIAGVELRASLTVQVDDFQVTNRRAAVSDANGNYTLAEFPITTKAIEISAAREGYALQKAPETSSENNQWHASDAVLQALSEQLKGTVVDVQNVPQKGVQVLAARFNSVAVSDENGVWQFEAIAPGDVEIVAVGAAGAVAQTVVAGRDAIQLKLQPFKSAPPRDIDGAAAVLDEAWETSRGSKFYGRDSLPATLAPYDPDAALAMARGDDAKASENSLEKIVQVLAQNDAERAREWAPQVLATLENTENKLGATLFVAQALVEKHPDEAKAYFQTASALYDKSTENYEKSNAAIALAKLSQQLELPNGEQWFSRALELLENQGNGFARLAWGIGNINVDWAQRTVEAAIKAAPTQPEYVQGPDSAADAAIRRVATLDVDAAQQMLEKYGAFKNPTYNNIYNLDRARSTVIVEGYRKNQDLETAFRSARELNSGSIRTLSQIAEIAPIERRAEFLRDTLKLARDRESDNALAILIAEQLLPYDRETAKQNLDEMRPDFKSGTSDRDFFMPNNPAAQWAYAYRNLDAAQSRWILEREWARLNGTTNTLREQWQWQRNSQLQKVVLAMATLDVSRAQQMIFALPLDDAGTPFAAAQVLAGWMLASDEERQTRAFEAWDDNNDDDGLSANRW